MPKLDLKATKHGFPRVKTPARLSEPLSQRLNAYALAAGAAGVAVLACAMPAEAAPVCKTLSAKLTHTSSFPLYLIDPAAAPFNIAQGTNSTFRSFTTTGRGTLMWWNRGFFTPNTAGAKVLLGASKLPADLAPGAEIGPGGQFGKGASYGLLFTYGRGHFSANGGGTMLKHEGNLNLAQTNYVGFQFNGSGALHYGWARLTVSFQNARGKSKHTVIQILGYGYESTPSTAIAAGSCGAEEKSGSVAPGAPSEGAQSAALGMLALGSEGLSRWRTTPVSGKGSGAQQ